MAKDYSKAFYASKAWKSCRQDYINSMPIYMRGLCERCYVQGKYVLGKELHHKIHLTKDNINDQTITLNHDNLILLCFDCHQLEHGKRLDHKYKFDSDGNILPLYQEKE